MKKILIVSKFFTPEITPRAFRTTELVKEFCRQENEVTLLLPNKEIYHKAPFKFDNLSIIYSKTALIKMPVDVASGSVKSKKNRSIQNQLFSFIKKVAIYFLPKELFITYDKGITKALCELNNKYDALISISQPLSIHLSVSIASIRNRHLKCKVKIAEFSDPMFKGEYLKTFPGNWLFGFLFARTFKYFVVPVSSAIPAFQYFKSRKKIKIIPQGFDFSNVLINEYNPNPVPTFAYAGRFYRELRDPEYFFKFLETIKTEFVFKLYIRTSDAYFMGMIKSYEKKARGNFIFCDLVPREQLILELSTIDFLVNFNNESSKMVPSKLIDYALTKRPVISFNSKTFNANTFKEFMKGNYNKAVEINLDNYDIKNVTRRFDELIEN